MILKLISKLNIHSLLKCEHMFKIVFQEISKDNLHIKSTNLSSPLQNGCYILKLLYLIQRTEYKSIIMYGKFINQSLKSTLTFQKNCSICSYLF